MIGKVWKVVKEVAIGILLVLSLWLVVDGALREVGSSFSFWKFITEALKFVPLLSLLVASVAFFFWQDRKFQEKRFEHFFLAFEKANQIYVHLRHAYHIHNKIRFILNKKVTKNEKYDKSQCEEILNNLRLELKTIEKECFEFMGLISTLDTIYNSKTLRNKSDEARETFHNSLQGFSRLFEEPNSHLDFLVDQDLLIHPQFGIDSLEENFYAYRKFMKSFKPFNRFSMRFNDEI
ncbi:hypothetical protein [Pantoea rwandensis]|uniref:Uncharacterized protein n=1 Tax=Pantoea rwandensis TaxID=1076550 RepID=A0A1X1CSZ8_9GAMM|nr:hypothetical protein [Pantoea rwandensis]ORM67542.1 hypothetical protein HA51_19000 [Pantoea rwandensis]